MATKAMFKFDALLCPPGPITLVFWGLCAHVWTPNHLSANQGGSCPAAHSARLSLDSYEPWRLLRSWGFPLLTQAPWVPMSGLTPAAWAAASSSLWLHTQVSAWVPTPRPPAMSFRTSVAALCFLARAAAWPQAMDPVCPPADHVQNTCLPRTGMALGRAPSWAVSWGLRRPRSPSRCLS